MGSTDSYDQQAIVAAHLRRLGDDACAAFVADLWNARGYETRREEAVVTATRGSESVVLSVGGAPEGTTPDIVVSLDGSHAAPPGGRVLDATDLAERLWYAVDRSVARELSERHLQATPEQLTPPLSMRVRERLPASPGVSASAALAVIVLALGVLTVAGLPGGIGNTADNTTGAVDTADVATPTQSLPPGVDRRGIRDIDLLQTAHARSVENRSVNIWVDHERPTSRNGNRSVMVYDMDVRSNGEQYIVDLSRGSRDSRTNIGSLYYDGETAFARIVFPERAESQVRYDTLPDEQLAGSFIPPHPPSLARNLATQHLSTPQTDVTGEIVRDGTTYYRVVATGQPESGQFRRAENYTAVAEISSSGFIRNLTVEYSLPGDDLPGDDQLRLRQEVTYERVNQVDVTPPEWQTEQFAQSPTPVE